MTSILSLLLLSAGMDRVVQVTWSDVEAIVDRHPRIAAGGLEVDAARAGVDAAGSVPNPVLEGNAGLGVARQGPGSRVEWGLALTVPLGWIAARGPRVEAAEAGVDLARAEARTLRREVLLELRTRFWNLVYAQARVASLEALETETGDLVRTVRARVEKGEARPVEAIRVGIELDKVTGERETAQTALEAERAHLALWLGAPLDAALVAVADLEALPAAMARDAALAGARASHPALAGAIARTRFLAAEVGIEKRARVPAVSITGFTAYELDRSGYGAGIAVDLPVWNWNSGRIAQAEASLSAGRKRVEAARLELEASVLETRAACEASVAAATRFKNRVVPGSEAAASTMEKSYQLGEASLLEVIDARRTLLDARRQYLALLSQAQIDCSRLGALVGEELP